jgi:hypothetical protein
MMSLVDGNAIAGTLRSVFGKEMTTTVGTCATCGESSPLAELRVYLDAPGVVGRCANCESVLVVIVENGGIACVDVSGFAALDQPTRV